MKTPVGEMTDSGLIREATAMNIRAGACVAELARRFPEFLVRDRARGFVRDIDAHDGDTEYTTDPAMARIFRGETWVEFWCRPEVGFWRSPAQVVRNAIPAVQPE